MNIHVNKLSRVKSFSIATVLGLIVATSAMSETPENWSNWRGPNGDGSSAPGNYPIRWNETNNVLWKAPLPGKGCSSPIVWGNHIFVTTPSGGQDSLLAFDWSGKELWRTKLGAERSGRHRNGSGSNASPATDGKSVFAYFKSGNLVSMDFHGKILWKTNLVEAFGRDTLYWDHGTSPVVTEKFVVMARLHQGESWLAAFDKLTGELKWKTARNYQTEAENDHGYNTPLVIRYENKESLLTWGGEHLTVHNIADGKLLWSATGFNPNVVKNWPAVATPVLIGDIVIVPHGRSDRGLPLLYGVKLGRAGEFDVTNHLWKRVDTGTFVPSPTVWQKKVYLLRDRGEVECLDPLTGKSFWNDSFPKTSANFYGSPTIVNGSLYAVREDGVIFVANVEGKFEVLAENNMGERVIATPVFLRDRILVRGEKNLFCLANR